MLDKTNQTSVVNVTKNATFVAFDLTADVTFAEIPVGKHRVSLQSHCRTLHEPANKDPYETYNLTWETKDGLRIVDTPRLPRLINGLWESYSPMHAVLNKLRTILEVKHRKDCLNIVSLCNYIQNNNIKVVIEVSLSEKGSTIINYLDKGGKA